MAVFSDIPSPFPLNVSLKSRPVSYRLQIDAAERIATGALTVFWAIACVAALVWAAGQLAVGLDGVVPASRTVASIAMFAVFYALLTRWLWPNLRAALSHIDVMINETSVEVADRMPLFVRKWSKPISEYAGVTIENWGTRTVENNKISVSAVMLVHPIERLSVPIHINGALRVKESFARRKAEELGLTLIDAPQFGIGAASLAPGTIVANSFQAFKVRALYALFGLGGLLAALLAASHALQTSEPALFIVVVLCLALAVAMNLYAAHYVTAMRSTTDGFEILTAALFRRRHRFARADVREVVYREGRSGAATPRPTHTPFVKVRVSGKRWPFIVDMQSEFVDEQALIELGEQAKLGR